MKGRLENELKNKRTIDRILVDCPFYLQEFYYSIQVSTEPLTCIHYIRNIKNFLLFANRDVTEIDDGIIARYFQEKRYVMKSDGELKRSSGSYLQLIYTALNLFFDYLYKKEVIRRNPMITIARPQNNDHVEKRYLSINDLNKILQAAQELETNGRSAVEQQKWKDRDILILFMLMNTGMRRTALSEINLDDISFEDDTLTVVDKRDKTQIYDITPEMKSLLLKWLSKREEILNGRQVEALFVSRKYCRLCSKAIGDIVKKYSKIALDSPITPHKLRGAFVTLYYDACGKDLEATRQAVGHSNISTTSRYIINENNPRKEAAVFMSNQLHVGT